MACCYAGCSNTRKKNPELTFFRFPQEKERRYLWLKRCNNASIQNFSFEDLQNRVVCESHFLPKCFDYSVLRSGRTRRCLFKFALPQPASVIAALKKEDVTLRESRIATPLAAYNIGSPPVSPVEGAQKMKDLVSPQRLVDILENSCPLIRPISPTSSEVDSTQSGDFPCVVPDLRISTPSPLAHDPNGEQQTLITSAFYSEEGNPLSTMMIAESDSTTTTTVTSTSANGYGHISTNIAATYSTFAPREITNKQVTEAYLPIVSANKRSLESISFPREEQDWTKSLAKTYSTKYKKILPKNEDRNGGGRGSRCVDLKCEPQRVSNIVIDARETFSGTTSPINKTCKKSDGSENVILNLSGLNIHKLEKTASKGTPSALITSLNLDNNFIQTLPTIDCYRRLTKVSLENNKIDSLIWFGKLRSLRVLNLSRNKLTHIDGLWKLWHLTHINVAGNEIQELRGHPCDPKNKLEFLDLSDNKISAIEDLSMLIQLKELRLHQNRIKSLSQCKMFLPNTLVKLTLADNSIMNLGDIAELSHLENLEILSLKQNHCLNILQLVDSDNNPVGCLRSFDYRPYVLTWCSHLASLDDKNIEEQERTKARWLFSQDKFRDISVVQHASLVMYLSDVCPLPPDGGAHERDDSICSQNELSEQIKVTALSQVSQATLPNPRSLSFGKIMPSLNKNDMAEKSSGCVPGHLTSWRNASSETHSTVDCSSQSPCKHYVELIEEKAKNYKLERNSEALESRIEDLTQRIQLLETTMVQNGFSIEDLCIKIEVEDENVESED